MTPGRDRDRGETFIELLFAIVLMLGTGAILISGLLASAKNADAQSQRAGADEVLTTASEAVIAAPFVPCAAPADYPVSSAATRYAVAVTSVQAWDGGAFVDGDALTPCAGLQRLTITVTRPDGSTLVAVVAKRESGSSG